MRIISHRGNLKGSFKEMENSPDQILDAIRFGFDVEVDVRMHQGHIYLGHDEPSFKTSFEWLSLYSRSLWIHCKDVESLEKLSSKFSKTFNFFWHQEDFYTLTSHGFVWVYPGHLCPRGSVKVIVGMPESEQLCEENLYGVCTDYPILLKQKSFKKLID